jgi:hypothetical protein
MVDQYAREVEDFRFIPLKDEWGTRPGSQNDRRLRVTVGINGWLSSKDDVTQPWRALADDSETFALRYEMNSLMGLGKSLQDLVSSYAWNTVKTEILKRTVLATLWSALWPAYLLSMASAVDNPFNLAKNRSEKAGEILADALINKVQGERPVTLIGYSLGARVIYSCLRSLAARRAFGLIDTVVFIGAPVPSNRQHWQMIRTVVSGKLFNVYSENDYLLAFLYRATSIQLGVAGLQEIKDIEGVENLNLSEEVQGHMRYAKLIAKILARCGVPVKGGADGLIEGDEDITQLSDLNRQNGNLIELDSLNITRPLSTSQDAPPPQYTPRAEFQRPLGQPNRQRTTVNRTIPSAVTANQDLLGLDLPDLPASSPNPSTTTKPTTTPSSPRPPPQPPRPQRNPAPAPAPSPPQAAAPEHTNPNFGMPPPYSYSAGGPTRAMPSFSAPSRTASSISAPAVPAASQMRPPARQSPRPASPVFTSSHSFSAVDNVRDDESSDEEGGMGIRMVDNDDAAGGLEYGDPAALEEGSRWR